MEIELIGLDAEDVAGRSGRQHILRKRLAQSRDVDPQSGGGVLGRVLTPELVDQPVSRNDLVGMQQEPREKRTRLRPSEGHLGAVVPHLERSQDPELHLLASLPARDANSCCAPDTDLKRAGSIVGEMLTNRIRPVIAVVSLVAAPLALAAVVVLTSVAAPLRIGALNHDSDARRDVESERVVMRKGQSVAIDDEVAASKGRRGASVVPERIDELQPSIEVAFPRESYAPGATARLIFFNSGRGVTLRIFHTGPEQARTTGNNVMHGLPVTRPVRIGTVRKGHVVRIRIGNWPSGLYFARLRSANRLVGFAPFVLRPRRLGEYRVAVVMSTLTWQAYNFRDDDGDGRATPGTRTGRKTWLRLGRPYLNRGVPYTFRSIRPSLPALAARKWTQRRLSRASRISTPSPAAVPCRAPTT